MVMPPRPGQSMCRCCRRLHNPFHLRRTLWHINVPYLVACTASSPFLGRTVSPSQKGFLPNSLHFSKADLGCHWWPKSVTRKTYEVFQCCDSCPVLRLTTACTIMAFSRTIAQQWIQMAIFLISTMPCAMTPFLGPSFSNLPL